MPKTAMILIKETTQFQSVKLFLNSKGRKSEKTKQIYTIALSHFQTFLSKSKYSSYDIETILSPLIQLKISVYFLLLTQ